MTTVQGLTIDDHFSDDTIAYSFAHLVVTIQYIALYVDNTKLEKFRASMMIEPI